MANKAYILNTITRIAHQRRGLTEECNTDQIVKRRDSHTVPTTYRMCEHCFPPSSVRPPVNA